MLLLDLIVTLIVYGLVKTRGKIDILFECFTDAATLIVKFYIAVIVEVSGCIYVYTHGA